MQAADTAGFSVSVADVASTATAFARTHTAAAGSLTTASGRLAGCAAMGGDDPVLAAWRTRYQAVARAAWTAASSASRTLHDVAATLVETGNAYLAADHASTPNRTGPAGRFPAVAPAVASPAGPPSATGPTGQEVPPQVAEYWPGGDPTRLRQAATSWNGLASGLDDAALDADRAFRTLTAHNTGRGFSAMAAFWSSRYVSCGTDPLFNAAPTGARLLGQNCAALADLIDETRTAMRNAKADTVAEGTPLRVVGGLLQESGLGLAADMAEYLLSPYVEWEHLDGARSSYLERLDELTQRLSVVEEERLDRAVRFPTRGDTAGLTVADAGEVVGLGLRGSGWDHLSGARPSPDTVHLDDDRRTHILDGDGPGTKKGGHRAGTGKPGKTEFPGAWTDEHIVNAVLSVGRDPDARLSHEFQSNNRWRIQGYRDHVLIEAILETDGSVVTAYPISGPGVRRNPK